MGHGTSAQVYGEGRNTQKIMKPCNRGSSELSSDDVPARVRRAWEPRQLAVVPLLRPRVGRIHELSNPYLNSERVCFTFVDTVLAGMSTVIGSALVR